MNGMELLSASLPLLGVVTLCAAIVRRHPVVLKWRLAVKHRPDQLRRAAKIDTIAAKGAAPQRYFPEKSWHL